MLKNAIDWLSRPLPDEVLVGKPVAVIGVTTGPGATRLAQSHLHHVLYATESLIMPQPSLSLSNASDLFDHAGRLVDESVRKRLGSILVSFNEWMDRATVPLAVAVPSKG